ncbi:hypothetical protein ACFPM7_15430 [Actinokineospora guangxiensis]|uniref:Uncharacterized protein n=1 Tax=Actinokineospora guangxiensis TaxID=1490288 RepID=A0ABW0EM02_9PSEU
MRVGESGPLPEGGAAWINRVWETQGSPARRWGARDRLMRLEQLVEACVAHGGSADIEENPTRARLMVWRIKDRPIGDTDVFDVCARSEIRRGGRRSVRTPDHHPASTGESEVVGKVEPDDEDAFAELLGEWTRLLSSPVVIDRSRE